MQVLTSPPVVYSTVQRHQSLPGLLLQPRPVAISAEEIAMRLLHHAVSPANVPCLFIFHLFS